MPPLKTDKTYIMATLFEKFGKYLLLEKLAAGGMAEVYLAKSAGANGVNKFVAIKRILPQFSTNQDFIDMFHEEAKVSVNLNHSNVVSIYDYGIEKLQFFIVMEFVEGRNLRQIINELKKLNRSVKIEEAVYLIKEAAAGLDHAHRCVDQHTGRPLNITHRDMSPQNIMVSFEGEIKVIDFGIAKKSESSGEETKAGTLKGKFAYMSPEQAEAEEVDPRTDVFALGIILWELLANDRLFTGSNENAVLRKVRECNPPSIRKVNPLVPVELDRIVTKALAKDKNVRYQTAANLQKDLNRFINTQYPDFSTQEFSKNIIDCFKASYAEAREKLIGYSKIEIPNTQDQDRLSHTSTLTGTVPSTANIDLPPTPGKLPPVPQAKTNIDHLNLEINPEAPEGLKNLKNIKQNIAVQQAAVGKIRPQPQQQSNTFNSSRMASETNVGYNTRITQHTKFTKANYQTKNSASENAGDVFIKLVIVAALGLSAYFGYNKYLENKLRPSVASTAKLIETDDLASTAQVKVSISSQPSGAKIYIDKVDSGQTTPSIISFSANKMTDITLIKEGYFDYLAKKSFSETSSLSATLQQQPSAGFVNINVQNGGAKPIVYINNQRLSESPPIKHYAVTSGDQITIKAINAITQLEDERVVKVEANKEITVDLILGRQK